MKTTHFLFFRLDRVTRISVQCKLFFGYEIKLNLHFNTTRLLVVQDDLGNFNLERFENLAAPNGIS